MPSYYEMGQNALNGMSELDVMGRQYQNIETRAWEEWWKKFTNNFRKPEDRVEEHFEEVNQQAREAWRLYTDAAGSAIRGTFDPKWGKDHERKFREEYERGRKTALLKDEVGTEYPTDADLICNEERYGLATPQFLVENGLSANLQKAISLAEFLKQHPDKKNPNFLKGCMVKANQDKKPENRPDPAKTDFQAMADAFNGKKVSAKAEPVKANPAPVKEKEEVAAHPQPVKEKEESESAKKVEMKANPAPVKENEEVAAAHPQPVAAPPIPQPPVQQNPMTPGFMSQFVKGIPLDNSNPQPQQPAIPGYDPYYTQMYQPMPTIPQQPQYYPQQPMMAAPIPQTPEGAVQYDLPPYAMESMAMYGMVQPMMQPIPPQQPVQGGQSNFNQPSPSMPPVGYVIKEREKRIIQDDGAVLEGNIPVPEVNPPAKKVIPAGAIAERQDVGSDVLSIVKGEHPEINRDSKIFNVLGTLKSCGYTVAFRELTSILNNTPVGIYEFHPFFNEQELGDLKFCVDTGVVFDKRMKFCIGASSNFETKDWYPLEINQGSKLIYFDEVLRTFFKKGKKELLHQRPMYNKLWREINRNFLDLSTIPSEALTSVTRKEFNGRISDMYTCRELQSKIEEICPNGTRFRVDQYDKETRVFTLVNTNVKNNILGEIRNDPAFIKISYDGETATLFSSTLSEDVVINVKASIEP